MVYRSAVKVGGSSKARTERAKEFVQSRCGREPDPYVEGALGRWYRDEIGGCASFWTRTDRKIVPPVSAGTVPSSSKNYKFTILNNETSGQGD